MHARTAPALPYKPSLYAPIRASFSCDPRLAPGSPLYNLLALPEGWGDNSPTALFDRLFSGSFQFTSYMMLRNSVLLCKICNWIIHYMHCKQDAAERMLEGMDPQDANVMPMHPNEPIQNPSAYAWSLFTDKAACPVHELEDLMSVESFWAAIHRAHTPWMPQPAMEMPSMKVGKPDSDDVYGGRLVVMQACPPHPRHKGLKELMVVSENYEASLKDNKHFWASAHGANKEGMLGSTTPASWKTNWRSKPSGYAITVDKESDLDSIEVQSVTSTYTLLGSESGSSLASPRCRDTQGEDEELHLSDRDLKFYHDLLDVDY